MARRGSKPDSDAAKILKGTFRADRSHEPSVVVLTGAPIVPGWLIGVALEVWHEKLAIYEARGQEVRGCEAALAQYCAIEADLIDKWQRRVDIPVALLNAHRIYANEFYDTPASQQAGGKKGGQEANPFKNNGKRAGQQHA
jgi:hypothetical protein